MSTIRAEAFDVDDDIFARSTKKQRALEDEECEGEQAQGRTPITRRLFSSPSPIKDVRRPAMPHANFNPFTMSIDAPSLLSNSTGDMTPNLAEYSSLLSPRTESAGSPTQKQLCREFRKTLSFVECDGLQEGLEQGSEDATEFSNMPSTPPSNYARHSPVARSAVRSTLRIQHKPLNDKNPTSRFEKEFELLGRLGGGSFGDVYKVRQRLDGCLYAVKVVRQEVFGQSGRERVLKEVYALAAVVNNTENPHIVRYFSSWIDVDDHLYIQTELCDKSLEDLYRLKLSNGTLARHINLEEQAIEVLRQLLLGLRGLHSVNVVHLDIKPANILIKNGTYKLGDLGHVAMARFVTPELPKPPPLRSAGRSTGSSLKNNVDERQRSAAISVAQDIDEGDVRYMARELLFENYEHLPKADIFSLAASVYELFLHKAMPANGEEWASFRDGHLGAEAASRMSPDMRLLLTKMIHPDPALRPSAEDLLAQGGILATDGDKGREQLRREVEILRGLHPHAVLKRANTM